MAENQKVDLSTLPKGLTKEEFTALPNFKRSVPFLPGQVWYLSYQVYSFYRV